MLPFYTVHANDKDKPNKTLKDLEDLVNFLAENVL